MSTAQQARRRRSEERRRLRRKAKAEGKRRDKAYKPKVPGPAQPTPFAAAFALARKHLVEPLFGGTKSAQRHIKVKKPEA